MDWKRIIIRDNKAEAIRRRHPWIFSGAVLKKDPSLEDGDPVAIYSQGGQLLGAGHFQQEGGIAVRLLEFGSATAQDLPFWVARLQNAWDYRRRLGLAGNEQTNAYRLVHGEGDGLPGLIIDIYAGVAVIQCHSAGMYLQREQIAFALREIFGTDLTAVYDKSSDTLVRFRHQPVADGYLLGASGPVEVKEYGHRFQVNWETGQKTGFFLDQRENRRLLGQYAAGKKVLNTFSYSGGFSVYALAAGAQLVHSVDASKKAIELADDNVKRNFGAEASHQSFAEDVNRFFKEHPETYDVMIVDPPAFAKNLSKRHNAVQGYKRLNVSAMQRLAPGGILFTFSCSQVVDMPLFYHTITAAAIEVGRPVRVMHQLSQPPDHPVSLFHPEGSYLKGLVLQVG